MSESVYAYISVSSVCINNLNWVSIPEFLTPVIYLLLARRSEKRCVLRRAVCANASTPWRALHSLGSALAAALAAALGGVDAAGRRGGCGRSHGCRGRVGRGSFSRRRRAVSLRLLLLSSALGRVSVASHPAWLDPTATKSNGLYGARVR